MAYKDQARSVLLSLTKALLRSESQIPNKIKKRQRVLELPSCTAKGLQQLPRPEALIPP